MTDEERARRDVEASLCAAVQRYLVDPQEPPASASLDAVLGALHDLLYVVWPQREGASPDGVRLALIERCGRRVILTGCIAMLYGGAGAYHRLRPMAVDLSVDTGGTIRVASASEEIELEDGAELKFADATVVRQWERSISLSAPPPNTRT